MKRQSYKIKHDFLFDKKDEFVEIPHLDSTVSNITHLKLSNVLNAKDEQSFIKLFENNSSNVLIIDDIGNCINPASERYKQFIIRCICRKAKDYNINTFF